MKLIKTVDFKAFQGGISVDYRDNFDALKTFYTYAPDQWDERAADVDADFPKDRRLPLVSELLDYHKKLGASKQVLDNINKLKNPSALVVMTGQQPGLLTGPLFTVYKAISVIKLAKRLSQQLRREVVPVFWAASEDHDLEEMNQAGLLNRQDEFLKINYPVLPKFEGWRVGEIPLKFQSGQNEGVDDSKFWNQLEQILGFYGLGTLNFIRETFDPSATWGEWFIRQMLSLFGKYGLIFLDPNQPGIRRLLTPIMREAIEEPLLFSRLVNEQGVKLAQMGYKDQIKRPEKACCFFLVEDGQRQRVDFIEGSYKTKKNDYTKEILLEKLENQPELFSANVILRPVCGEFLFPNLAYIGGNAEIAYFAQLRPVFEKFNIKMPIVLPRHSVTLIESRIEKILEEYKIEPMQLKSEVVAQIKEIGRNQCRLASPQFWEELKKQIMTPLKDLYDVSKLEQMATPALEAGIKKIDWQLGQMEEKMVQQCQKNNQLLSERINRAHNILFPQNMFQERILNFYYFYNKYGAELIDNLMTDLPEDTSPHYFLGM